MLDFTLFYKIIFVVFLYVNLTFKIHLKVNSGPGFHERKKKTTGKRRMENQKGFFLKIPLVLIILVDSFKMHVGGIIGLSIFGT